MANTTSVKTPVKALLAGGGAFTGSFCVQRTYSLVVGVL